MNARNEKAGLDSTREWRIILSSAREIKLVCYIKALSSLSCSQCERGEKGSRVENCAEEERRARLGRSISSWNLAAALCNVIILLSLLFADSARAETPSRTGSSGTGASSRNNKAKCAIQFDVSETRVVG